jgi:hypothetical protein
VLIQRLLRFANPPTGLRPAGGNGRGTAA